MHKMKEIKVSIEVLEEKCEVISESRNDLFSC